MRVCRTRLSPQLHRTLRPDAAPAARTRRRPRRRVLTNARLLTRLAKLDLLAIRRLEDRHRCATPSGVTSPRSSRTGPSAASTRIASQFPVTDQLAVHRRRQPGRRHLRPACSKTRTASSGPSARCDGHTAPRRPVRRRRHQHPNAGCAPAARPDPLPHAASPAGAGRPMDRAGGMENAHDTLAADCTRVEARFPPRLGRHRTPPTRPTGKIVVLFEHDATGSISCAGHGLTAPTDRAECGSSTPPASVLSAGTLRVKRVSAAAGTDRNRASDRLGGEPEDVADTGRSAVQQLARQPSSGSKY